MLISTSQGYIWRCNNANITDEGCLFIFCFVWLCGELGRYSMVLVRHVWLQSKQPFAVFGLFVFLFAVYKPQNSMRESNLRNIKYTLDAILIDTDGLGALTFNAFKISIDLEISWKTKKKIREIGVHAKRDQRFWANGLCTALKGLLYYLCMKSINISISINWHPHLYPFGCHSPLIRKQQNWQGNKDQRLQSLKTSIYVE